MLHCDRLSYTDYVDDFTANGNDSLIGYEYKLTQDTYTTWNDAETAAKNVYAHLVSFQTDGEAKLTKNIISDSNHTTSIWYGLYYDNYEGPETTTSTTDSRWKFIDRTQTYYERGSSTIGGVTRDTDYTVQTPSNSSVYSNDKIYNHANQANNKAILKRPQMWVPGTGSLSDYEYLHVPITGYSWDMHETKAQELGGHLVSIHSAEEIEFISTLVNFGMKEDNATQKVTGYHIGLNTGANRNQIFNKNLHTLSYSDGTPYDFKFSSFNDPHNNYDNDVGLYISSSFVYGSALIEWWDGSRSRELQYFIAALEADDLRKGGVAGSSGAATSWGVGVGAIYKRKRNSWRIVDGKDTIYRFGEPTISNTGSYADTIEPLVMQPVYRNTQETTVQNPARVVDGNYVTRTVANLTVTEHGDYDGVYNYSNFKTDSTRKWVKSDNPNITIEYKKENHTLYGSGYSWNLYNNGVLVIFGSTDNNPWSNIALSTPWGNPLPTLTRWGNHTATPYNLVNGTYAQAFNYDPDDPAFSDGYPSTGQRGPGYLWNYGRESTWGTFAFTPETYFFNQTPGVVSYFGINQPQRNYLFICIYPANKTDAELVPNNTWKSTDDTDMFHIHWSWATKRWYYFKDGTEVTNIHQDNTDNFQSIEITYEPDTDGVYQYYMNFFARSAGTDIYAVNYPYDVKLEYLVQIGIFLQEEAITHLSNMDSNLDICLTACPETEILQEAPGGEPRIYTRWIYHDRLPHTSMNVAKFVTATTNTETNLQITGQLSGAGQTTSINLEHGITMTEGSGASDSTVSVDKTNGVNIQNTDLSVTNGNMTLTNGDLDIIDENSNSILKTDKLSSQQPTLIDTRASTEYNNSGWYIDKVNDGNNSTAWAAGDNTNNYSVASDRNSPQGSGKYYNETTGVAYTNGNSAYTYFFYYNGQTSYGNTNDIDYAYGEWIQFEYSTPSVFRNFELFTNSTGSPKHITILGSNTGTGYGQDIPAVWYRVFDKYNIPQNNGGETYGPYGETQPTYKTWDHTFQPFKYFRVIVRQNHGYAYVHVYELKLNFITSGSVDIPILFSRDIQSSRVLVTSDRRIKNDITLVDDTKAIDLVNTLESKEYGYIDPYNRKTQKTIGFIAQEVT